MSTKYIFITGGVVSSLGKGITAASLGRLLKERGYKVTIQKLDPYLNIDPGTMSPYQHGEVFVTYDGAETDLDLGHYERFIDENLTKYSSVTNGKILSELISNERQGKYLGKTVQYIPNVTNLVKEHILKVGQKSGSDIVITEIGGTVGDIESEIFLEAIRQFKKTVGKENVAYIHVTLLPYISAAKELKTKPTQQSVKILQGLGISPDIIVLRSEHPVTEEIKDKISLFCDVEKSAVIPAYDANNIYEVPVNMENVGLSKEVLKVLNLEYSEIDMNQWNKMLKSYSEYKHTVEIAVVGKYTALKDAYISIHESLEHAGFSNLIKPNITYINADKISEYDLKKFHGILVPGGFGGRGIEGKLSAIKFARENNIPFFGICLGMQLATIEFARNVLNLENAHTTEIDENTKYPVISLMDNQIDVVEKGATMRLGQYPCILNENSLAYKLYAKKEINERHRHRYEFNNEFRDLFNENGFMIYGTSPDNKYVELIEIPKNDFFVASQYHPEFLSRPNKPHPLFVGFILASKNRKDKNV